MDWRDVPSLAALRAFEAASRLGSFSGAARELNVTHAAIAQHVRNLEDHFNARLMVREGRSMTTTSDGRNLAESVSNAFTTIGHASRELLNRGKEQPTRVALTPNFTANWLMPRIGDFWQKYPEIELELLPSNGLVDLRRDNIDLAIRYGRGPWPGVDMMPLVPGGHVAVGSTKRYAKRAGEPLSTFHGDTWLVEQLHKEESVWVSEHGIELSEEKVIVHQSPDLVREAAKAGIGIAILTEPTVAAEIAAGTLVELARQDDETLAYYILKRPGTLSKDRDIFIKWLKNQNAP